MLSCVHSFHLCMLLLWPHPSLLVDWPVSCCLPHTRDSVVGNALPVPSGVAPPEWPLCSADTVFTDGEDCEKKPLCSDVWSSGGGGSIYFPEMSLRCCYTLIGLLELMSMSWVTLTVKSLFFVNEKLTQEVTRATWEVWREDCIRAQIWGGLDQFSCLQRSFPRAEQPRGSS